MKDLSKNPLILKHLSGTINRKNKEEDDEDKSKINQPKLQTKPKEEIPSRVISKEK